MSDTGHIFFPAGLHIYSLEQGEKLGGTSDSESMRPAKDPMLVVQRNRQSYPTEGIMYLQNSGRLDS